MDDLRLVRREDQSLIVATEGGEEFRLVVDETVLAELRHLSRPARGPVRANPREVQALVRAGKTRAEIARLTGLEESDIERYEEPVLAERRYVLERAQAVAVRTSPSDEAEQQFGTVIAERLVGLGAAGPEWASWRDDEAGWMIALTFRAGDAEHRAVWSFDHRKGLLSPLTPDAESLSKQGGVGDRLIPKLRAVDSTDRFDSGAFDPEKLTAGFDDGEEAPVNLSGPVAPDHPSTGSIPVVDAEEYARRQHIEERAIKSPARELPDLGQTADLLDALRRRRGERDAVDIEADGYDEGAIERDPDPSEDGRGEPTAKAPVPFPGAAPVMPFGTRVDDEPVSDETLELPVPPGTAAGQESADGDLPEDAEPREPLGPANDRGRRGKGRASIPSWDDILFGTRSEDDPA